MAGVLFDQIIEKLNPYHGKDGRFSTADAAASFTYKPGASTAHDKAIEREKERNAKGFKGRLFHGSPATDIEEFDMARAGQNTSSGEKLLFFTDSKQMADDFSYERLEGSTTFMQRRGKKGRVYEVDVEMENPLDLRNLSEKDVDNLLKLDPDGILTPKIAAELSAKNNQQLKTYLDLTAENLKGLGYDGLIANTGKAGHNSIEYAVVDSKQAKIVKGLTFDEVVEKFNPYHGKDGRFASKDGGGVVGGSSAELKPIKPDSRWAYQPDDKTDPNDMIENPIPFVGVGPDMDLAVKFEDETIQTKYISNTEVNISELQTLQPFVLRSGIEEYKPWDESDRPYVVDFDGKKYVIDGNHRIAQAKLKGEKAVNVDISVREMRVKKNFDEIIEIEKFNPYHDRLGRFATASGFMGAWDGPEDRRAITFSANPKTLQGQNAIVDAGHGVMRMYNVTAGGAPVHKNVAELENKNRKLRHEEAYAFDDEGNLVFSKGGDRNSVSFTRDECSRLYGTTFTHNHPGGSVFSMEDIFFLEKNGLKEMRATQPNGGVFSMKKIGPNTTGKSFAIKYAELYQSSVARAQHELGDRPAKLIFSGKITYKDANNMLRLKVDDKIIPWLTKNAEAYGYTFVKADKSNVSKSVDAPSFADGGIYKADEDEFVIDRESDELIDKIVDEWAKQAEAMKEGGIAKTFDEIMKWDPSQPRDKFGMWTSGGGGMLGAKPTMPKTTMARPTAPKPVSPPPTPAGADSGSGKPQSGQLTMQMKQDLGSGKYPDRATAQKAYIREMTGQSEEEAEATLREMHRYTREDWRSADSTILDKYIDQDHAYHARDGIARGMVFDDADYQKFAQNIKPGAQIGMRGNSSWTSEMSSAQDFAESSDLTKNSVIIKCVLNKTSSPIAHLSAWQGESEVLAKSTAKWKVLDVKEYAKKGAQTKTMYITVEEV